MLYVNLWYPNGLHSSHDNSLDSLDVLNFQRQQTYKLKIWGKTFSTWAKDLSWVKWETNFIKGFAPPHSPSTSSRIAIALPVKKLNIEVENWDLVMDRPKFILHTWRGRSTRSCAVLHLKYKLCQLTRHRNLI